MVQPLSQRGTALPFTLFLVAFLTVLLSALFVRIRADQQIAYTSTDALKALSLAQNGLEAYYQTRTTRPPDNDTLRVNLIGGYVDVVASLLQVPEAEEGERVFLVRATSRVVVPDSGPEPQAVRTVGEVAVWRPGPVGDLAAFTAANHLLRVTDGTGIISIDGHDACAGSGMPTLPGLRAPLGKPLPMPANRDELAGPPEVDGDPPIIQELNANGTAEATNVDWTAILNGGFEADYTSLTDLQSWSAYLIDGDLTLSQSGTGLLVVTGDLTIGGYTTNWRGVVLVGGTVLFEAGATQIEGLVVSGLNEQLSGPSVSHGYVGETGRNVFVQYNSCYVTDALRRHSGFAPVPGTRIEYSMAY